MTTSFQLPKQWVLTEYETITTYANWQTNMLYHLSLCSDFARFLETEWQRVNIQHRGLTDDSEAVQVEENRKTAIQKQILLERMLGLIVQFVPFLLRFAVLRLIFSVCMLPHGKKVKGTRHSTSEVLPIWKTIY